MKYRAVAFLSEQVPVEGLDNGRMTLPAWERPLYIFIINPHFVDQIHN